MTNEIIYTLPYELLSEAFEDIVSSGRGSIDKYWSSKKQEQPEQQTEPEQQNNVYKK